VPDQGIPAGFSIAALLGAAAYSALFILLSVVSSRALVFGLGYVFIWEGLVTSLFAGTRWLSIRQYCLGVAGLVSSARKDDFAPDIPGFPALVLIVLATLIALVLATRRLQRLELTETD